MAAQISESMGALRRDSWTVWPGMTIYGIGDTDHAASVSGHNPDDTPGVRAELSDLDSKQEYRALDWMLGPKFSEADGWALVTALVKGSDRNRLYYVIYKRTIWARVNNFEPEGYLGPNPHDDHVHGSGWAGDDENGAPWRSVLALRKDIDMATLYKADKPGAESDEFWISNGVHRRGPIRKSNPTFGLAIATTQGFEGAIVMSEAQRVAGNYDTWEKFLDAVAGPVWTPGTGGGGVAAHTHTVSPPVTA